MLCPSHETRLTNDTLEWVRRKTMSKHLRYEATVNQVVEIKKVMAEDGCVRVKFVVGDGKVMEGLITKMTNSPEENIQAVGESITRAQKERLLRLLMDERIDKSNKEFIRGYLMKEGLTKKGASKVIWMALKEVRQIPGISDGEPVEENL